MKNINGKYVKNYIAGFLVVCMAFADASLAVGTGSHADSVVVEEHDLDTYLADGNYNGNDSDSEIAEEKTVELATGKGLFNILEILPTEKKGVVGYTVGGCEPFEGAEAVEKYEVTKQQMREAYMDACVNPNPGKKYNNDDPNSDNLLDHNTLTNLIKQGLKNTLGEGGIDPFRLETGGEHSGYYKYVGPNKGVFALEKDSNGNIVKDDKGNPVFRSKFYFDSGNYDYIFVYGKTSTKTDTTKIDVDYNVTNQKRIRYVNNEKFLKEIYGLDTDSKVKEWKDTHVVEVTTRTPVSVSYDDIERADVIILNNADGSTMRYYKYALEINNILRGEINIDKDNDATFYDASYHNPYNSDNHDDGIDFDDFEKVVRIYERVAVREDAAFVGSVTVIRGTTFNTNIRKLMCMLFYVYKESDKYESDNNTGASRHGSGRDLFMNLIKRYASDPGDFKKATGESALKYIDLQKLHEKYKNDPDINVRNRYPDYRAPMLRHSDYYDENGNVKIPYSHYYKFNPGHPLVKDYKDAIIGGSFNETTGMLEPKYATSAGEAVPREMRRKDRTMFDLDNLTVRTLDYDKDGFIYRADMYHSMSNTTDYIFIDSDGDLVRSGKYAGYWFNMDDDGAGQHQYKRIMWDTEENSTWPWDTSGGNELNAFKYWFFHTTTTNSDNSGKGRWEKGNLHLWFDLYEYADVFGIKNQYRAINDISPGDKFRNQAVESENGLFKSAFMKSVVNSRKFDRENHDPNHVVERNKEDYYISMNILNGDGVNEKAEKKNKTLYYNEYEKSSAEAKQNNANTTYIPIKIRIKSSDRLNSIKLYQSVKGEGGTMNNKLLATYELNTNVSDAAITSTGSVTTYFSGKAPHAKARTLKLTPNNELDPSSNLPKLLTSSSKKPIYTYEGEIHAELSEIYFASHNTKFVVELSAEKPYGNTADPSDDVKIADEIMIVRRDFFALD